MKETTKLVCKGILLYTTFIICMLSAMGIDSIYDENYLIADIVTCVTLIYICYKTISKEELEVLTLAKYFNNQEHNNEW